MRRHHRHHRRHYHRQYGTDRPRSKLWLQNTPMPKRDTQSRKSRNSAATPPRHSRDTPATLPDELRGHLPRQVRSGQHEYTHAPG